MLEQIQHPESCIKQSLPNDMMNVYFGQGTFSPNPVCSAASLRNLQPDNSDDE